MIRACFSSSSLATSFFAFLICYLYGLRRVKYGSSRGRVVSLRNSITRTAWQSFWGAKRDARRESLAEDCLNLFEKTRTASVLLVVVITSHLTVRRSWKLMRSASCHQDLLLALVKDGFGVGSCMVRVVSLSN